MISKNKKNKKETIEKWNGKTIYDKKYNEYFLFDTQRDWVVLFNFPERFECRSFEDF